MKQLMEIEMLPGEASANTADMQHITGLVNRAFAGSETGIWKSGAVRTTVDEITKLTKDGEIAVARIEGQIAGCVRVMQLDQETGEFGMLAVAREYQGTGTGRELVRFAERQCQRKQLATMQLELLVPREGTHPAKENLENWYQRLGYERVATESFGASFPEMAKMLAVPCDFIIFQKEFRQAVSATNR